MRNELLEEEGDDHSGRLAPNFLENYSLGGYPLVEKNMVDQRCIFLNLQSLRCYVLSL